MERSVSEVNSLFERQNKLQQGFPGALTIEFDQLLRLLTYSFGSRDRESIITKKLTPITFWMFLDACYFTDLVLTQFNRINSFRTRELKPKYQTFFPSKESYEENKFILKLRSYAALDKNQLSLFELKLITIDELIKASENALELQKNKINQQLQQVQNRFNQQQIQRSTRFCRLRIPYIQSSPSFRYSFLENQIIQELAKNYQRKIQMPSCQICFLPQKTITCIHCKINVHPCCYPFLPQNYNLLTFECQNCLLNIPSNTNCVLCPCQDGNFFPISAASILTDFQLQQSSDIFKLTFKKSKPTQNLFIHYACYSMNSCLSFDPVTQQIQGLHYINKLKTTTICSICNTAIGVTIVCSGQNCRKYYHPQCARREKLDLMVIRGDLNIVLQLFCQRHQYQQPFKLLKDSCNNKIRELKRFYDKVYIELKRLHDNGKTKKNNGGQESTNLFCLNSCLICGKQHDYDQEIRNCTSCYNWYHLECSPVCIMCIS